MHKNRVTSEVKSLFVVDEFLFLQCVRPFQLEPSKIPANFNPHKQTGFVPFLASGSGFCDTMLHPEQQGGDCCSAVTGDSSTRYIALSSAANEAASPIPDPTQLRRDIFSANVAFLQIPFFLENFWKHLNSLIFPSCKPHSQLPTLRARTYFSFLLQKNN